MLFRTHLPFRLIPDDAEQILFEDDGAVRLVEDARREHGERLVAVAGSYTS
jgi:hypothetical protein